MLRKVPWALAAAQTLWRLTRPRFSAGAVAVVVNERNGILLVEHVLHPHTPWGLPGGWVERGEDPEDTLHRELMEELGLKIEVGPIVALKRSYDHHLDAAYLCRPIGEVGALSAEILDHRWMTIDEMPRLHRFHQYAVDQAVALLHHALGVSLWQHSPD